MQYFKQAVQTRQPEHCAKHTNQRQKRRKETMCGQSPSSPVYLRTVRQGVRLSLRVLPSLPNTFSSHKCGRKHGQSDVSTVWKGSQAAFILNHRNDVESCSTKTR